MLVAETRHNLFAEGGNGSVKVSAAGFSPSGEDSFSASFATLEARGDLNGVEAEAEAFAGLFRCGLYDDMGLPHSGTPGQAVVLLSQSRIISTSPLTICKTGNIVYCEGRGIRPMRMSDEITELAAALAAAHAEIEDATKDARNDHFKSRYADLAAVKAVIREPLAKHGIFVIQPSRTEVVHDSFWVEVDTVLMHKSGQFMSECLRMPVSKADAHGVGSAVTYARRYGLMAMLNIAADDDDGNAAVADKGPAKGSPITFKKDPNRPSVMSAATLEKGKEAATKGTSALRDFYKAMDSAERESLSSVTLAEWKSTAAKVDALAQNIEVPDA